MPEPFAAAGEPHAARRLRALREIAWRVPKSCRPAFSGVLRTRIGTLAPVVALLTLAWIPLDIAALGWSHANGLALLRVSLATALLLLVRMAPRLRARTLACGFLWLQVLGFGLLQWRVDATGSSASGIGYGLFPFVIAAQLAAVPLPWLRSALAALAPAALLALFLQSQRGPAPWNEAWLFVLIAGVAVWTSGAQLRLLVDLLGARADAAQDALTGLANRRAAGLRLQAEYARARRNGSPLSVLLLDLDHFKQVNDQHGHAAGDLVLAAVAGLMRGELRGIDLPARHGGEEFLAILPGTGATAALEVAERLRAGIAALPVRCDARWLHVTASIGVATLAPGEAASTLLERVDAALYAAKAAGRNRCMAAQAPAPLEA